MHREVQVMLNGRPHTAKVTGPDEVIESPCGKLVVPEGFVCLPFGLDVVPIPEGLLQALISEVQAQPQPQSSAVKRTVARKPRAAPAQPQSADSEPWSNLPRPDLMWLAGQLDPKGANWGKMDKPQIREHLRRLDRPRSTVEELLSKLRQQRAVAA